MRSFVSSLCLSLAGLSSLIALDVSAQPAPATQIAPSLRIHRPIAELENCPSLPPLGLERLVLYATHEGAAVSSVALGDREEATVADVFIEAGSDPLYVILSSTDTVIWRFGGDIDRVAKVYAQPARSCPDIPAAGVVSVE